MSGTASAWQVREMQRQELLEKLKRKVFLAEEQVGKSELHRVLLISSAGCFASEKAIPTWDNVDLLRDIPRAKVIESVAIYTEIMNEMINFGRTIEERQFLAATFFMWIAEEMARPVLTALHAQEFHEPEKIYGTKDRTTEISFE